MQREVKRNKHEPSETISTLNLGRVTGDGTSEAVWIGLEFSAMLRCMV